MSGLRNLNVNEYGAGTNEVFQNRVYDAGFAKALIRHHRDLRHRIGVAAQAKASGKSMLLTADSVKNGAVAVASASEINCMADRYCMKKANPF